MVQKLFVKMIHDAHSQHPPDLENEPRHIDPRKLTNMGANNHRARDSILEYNTILRSEEDGYAMPGQEIEVDFACTGKEAVPSHQQDLSKTGPSQGNGPFYLLFQPTSR